MQNRRTAIKNLVSVSALPLLSSFSSCTLPQKAVATSLKGNIHHSVCRWCFNDMPLNELCEAVKKIGFSAIDLVGPKDWPVLQQYGIYSSMCNGAEINLVDGWNDTQFHATLIKNYSEMIPLVAKNGYKNLICFSGNKRDKTNEEGLKNCVTGLKKIIALAEKNNVTLVMELLNSKRDHKDYQCDNTAWGVELCQQLGSENFKLLYDIYHMQVNEGNIIDTIRKNHQYFAHYHTAGVPGRNELDNLQELNYPAIMKAIVDTGFKGYVAQEFIPKKEDKLASLAEAIQVCDV